MIQWIYPTLIDNDEVKTIKKDVSDDMVSYVKLLVNSIENSKRQTKYNLARETTEVSQIVLLAAKKSTYDKEIEHKCQFVADRFLEKEYNAKEKIEKMNKTIRNGCLIQALIKISEVEYKYVIAKGDWSDFLEKNDFLVSEGIHINNKNLGKSCIFYIKIDSKGNAIINDCEVLLDNPAVYFWGDFLELEKSVSDEESTKNMVKKVVSLIDKSFRKEYPKVRQNLRSTFITYLHSNDSKLVDFENIKETIFVPYLDSTNMPKSEKEKFFSDLDKLPGIGKNKFSKQFICIKSKIGTDLIKSKYVLDKHVFLEIQDDFSESEMSRITAGKDEDQKIYVKIYTDNEEVLKTFGNNTEEVEE